MAIKKKTYNKETYVAKEKPTTKDIQERLLNNVLKALENGTVAWQRGWGNGDGFRLPVNAATFEPYKGMNILLLNFNGFSSPIWGTFKCWSDLGCWVKKGAVKTDIYKWGGIYKDGEGNTVPNPTEDEKPRLKFIPFLTTYQVYNADQIQDSDEKKAVLDKYEKQHPKKVFTEKVIPLEIQSVFDKLGATVNYGGDRAYYSPMLDKIQLPNINQFDTVEGAISVMAHEYAHWTGHATRLNRDGVTNFDNFGSHQYSLEELVAEFAAQIVCINLGIDCPKLAQNSTSYLVSWTKKLSDPENRDWIYKGLQQAQKAADYILGNK
jgi:antirestriction protein ArdC